MPATVTHFDIESFFSFQKGVIRNGNAHTGPALYSDFSYGAGSAFELLFKTQSLVLVEGHFYCIEKNSAWLGVSAISKFIGCNSFFAFGYTFF